MPTNDRYLKDAELIKAKALPAAGATAYTDAIDFAMAAIGPRGDDIEAELAVPALPALAEGKKFTLRLQDSDDGVAFADIPELAALELTGAVGGGAAATTRFVRLPRTARRYLRASLTVEAAGGDNTAVEAALSLLF